MQAGKHWLLSSNSPTCCIFLLLLREANTNHHHFPRRLVEEWSFCRPFHVRDMGLSNQFLESTWLSHTKVLVHRLCYFLAYCVSNRDEVEFWHARPCQRIDAQYNKPPVPLSISAQPSSQLSPPFTHTKISPIQLLQIYPQPSPPSPTSWTRHQQHLRQAQHRGSGINLHQHHDKNQARFRDLQFKPKELLVSRNSKT